MSDNPIEPLGVGEVGVRVADLQRSSSLKPQKARSL